MLPFRKNVSFPAEIIDEIIDLVGETPTLLSLGLICKRTLAKTRSRLFSVLEFTKADSFNQFLKLAGAPWTSFTSSVREIRLQDLSRSGYWFNGRNPRRAALNLCNVKSLSIIVHSSESSTSLPDLFLEFISHLKIRDLQLDGVAMWKQGKIILLTDGVPDPVPEDEEDAVMLFTHLPPSVETLAFQNLLFDDIPKSLRRLPPFQHPLRFRILDSISLALFKKVFDPLTHPDLNVSVKTFHIRSQDSIPAAKARARSLFTRRFLHHVGHSVEQLVVTLNTPRRIIKNIPPFLDPSQLSHCTNVRMIYFIFNHYMREEELSSLVSVMWKMLYTLPSPSTLEECWLKFTPFILEAQLESFGFLESPNVLQKLRLKFPKLKMIKVVLGIHEVQLQNAGRFYEALRQSNGLAELEENGMLKIVTVNLTEHVACHSKLEGCR